MLLLSIRLNKPNVIFAEISLSNAKNAFPGVNEVKGNDVFDLVTFSLTN